MIKANVGLSRKMSKDFNSTGFSLNIEAEINATLDDPEKVIERIRELYDLADETLQRQIDVYQSDSAIASRDDDSEPESNHGRFKGYLNGHSNGHQTNGSNNDHSAPRNGHQNGKTSGNVEPATNKQIQFLQTLAKRQKLYGPRLEGFIQETIGRNCSPYDLTKKEAGNVINALNPEEAGENGSRR